MWSLLRDFIGSPYFTLMDQENITALRTLLSQEESSDKRAGRRWSVAKGTPLRFEGICPLVERYHEEGESPYLNAQTVRAGSFLGEHLLPKLREADVPAKMQSIIESLEGKDCRYKVFWKKYYHHEECIDLYYTMQNVGLNLLEDASSEWSQEERNIVSNYLAAISKSMRNDSD